MFISSRGIPFSRRSEGRFDGGCSLVVEVYLSLGEGKVGLMEGVH